MAGPSGFETPAISDLLNRLYTMATPIKLVTDPSHKLAGPACTGKVYPGDNLMVHKALDIARPDDVVVVDASASMMTAVLGDLISTKARRAAAEADYVAAVARGEFSNAWVDRVLTDGGVSVEVSATET